MKRGRTLLTRIWGSTELQSNSKRHKNTICTDHLGPSSPCQNSSKTTMEFVSLETPQKFLDENQFSLKSIQMFQRVLGQTWMSPNREAQIKEILMMLDLVPGQRVLDLGSGAGGMAFSMARYFGVYVHGIDFSSNMNQVAQNHLAWQEEKVQGLVQFDKADMTKMQLEGESYDVIHSRDSFMYIADKESLFKKMQEWLRPGGTLLIVDYCRGTSESQSLELEKYIELRRWSVPFTVAKYEEALQKAGFKDVRAWDITDELLETYTELQKFFISMQECFIQDFGEKSYDEVLYMRKVLPPAIQAGTLSWGLFKATK